MASIGRQSGLRRFAGLSASLLLLLAPVLLVAQDFPGTIDYTIPANPHSIPDYSGSLNVQPTRAVGGYGVMGRLGHEVGDTVGREGSLSYFDLSPFSFHGDWIFFGDGRLFLTNHGKMGGSAGLGIRHFFPSKNAILGSTFYYDHDESRGVTFEQFTVAGELLTEFLDVRANVYLPFGNRQQVTGVRFEPGTQQFVDAIGPGGVQGSNISFQTRTFSSAALEGVDLTLTTPIQGELAERFNLEFSAGGYHYQARGLGLEDVSGFKLRMDGDILNRLSHLFLEVTSDNVFDTNVVFGADVNYWHHLQHRPRLRKSQFNRMASWVRRSRTVSTLDSSALDAPQLAINPNTSLPYLVYHVRNNPTPPPNNFPAPLGNGSENMPYQYMQEAIDASPFADIVFVHGNSVFDGLVDGNANATAILRDDVLVLGEGVPLTIPVEGIVSSIDLPTVTPGVVNRPIIQNVTGPAITMGNNSRFAGFQIENYQDGPAVLMNGINRAELNELIIDGSTGVLGNGINIINSTGTIVLENITISNTEGDAFFVNGGNAAIVFNGDNLIENSSGFAALILDAGGSVNMRSTTIDDDGGEGILVSGTNPGDSTANVTFNLINLANTNLAPGTGAFQVENHSGAVTVLNDLSVTNPGAGGISILNLQPSGNVTFQGPVTITDRNDFGIVVSDIAEGPNPANPSANRAGAVSFQSGTTVTGIGASNTTAPAVIMDSSSGTMSFLDLAINGSNSSGIQIANLADTGTTTGRFIVIGQTNISNTNIGIDLANIEKGNFQTIFNNLTIDAYDFLGISVFETNSSNRFLGSTLIGNTNDVTTPAIFIGSNTGDTAFNQAQIFNGQSGGAGDTAVLIVDNINPVDGQTANVSFNLLDVQFFGAAALGDSAIWIENNERVEIGTGIIEAEEARAITVIDNQFHNITFEAITASDDDFGIFVSDSIGRFGVSGRGLIRGSGGLISGMTVAGAHFDNTQFVSLNFMELSGNNIGVRGNNVLLRRESVTPDFILRGMDINNSVNEGIQLQNVSDFLLTSSFLLNNGLGGARQIDFLATTRLADINDNGDATDQVVYNVDIINNDISDGQAAIGADMIGIRTGAGMGTQGAPLNVQILNNGIPGNAAVLNSISSNRPGNSTVDITWTGPSSILIDNNTFLLGNGANQTGIELNITGIADVLYSNNDFSSNGFGDTALDFFFSQSANVIIRDNVSFDPDTGAVVAGSGFLMNGNAATGMSLTFFGQNNNVEIDSNLLNMTGVDTVGIEFERIFAPSTVRIDNNVIVQQTDFLFPREEGIIFRDVRGVITLQGSQDNTVSLGTLLPFFIDFFIPQGTSTGSIIVNGSPRP